MNKQIKDRDEVLKLEFESPIGVVHVLKNGIVHIHITEIHLTIRNLEAHYTTLEKHLLQPKHPFILTFSPNYLKLDAETRRYNNRMMNHWSSSMAVVVEKPLIRAFVYMYIKINPLIYDIKVFESFDEAKKWIIGEME